MLAGMDAHCDAHQDACQDQGWGWSDRSGSATVTRLHYPGFPARTFFPLGIGPAAQRPCKANAARGPRPRSSHRSSPSLSWPISSDRQAPALSAPQSPCPAKHTKRIHYPMGDRKEGLGGGGRRTMRTSGARGRPYCVWAGRAGTPSAAPSMAALCLSPPSPRCVPLLGAPPSSRRCGQCCQPTLCPVLSCPRTPLGVLMGLEGLSFWEQSEWEQKASPQAGL